MPDLFDAAPFAKEIREELLRIGLGGGVDLGGAVTPEQLLEALRATPDGAGSQALLASLQEVLRRESGR